MRRRRALAGLAVLALLAITGCTGAFGGTGPDEQALAENATYDWETNATTEVQLSEGAFLQAAEYQVVYSGNASELELYTRGLTRAHAVPIRAVQYRYENGTVAGHEAVSVSQSARRTTVRPPEGDGQLAFSGQRRDQELALRTIDDGSLRVVLPPNHTVGDILLGHVVPRGYDLERTADGRNAVTWDDVENDRQLLVRHYRQRDRVLFYAMVGVLGVAALAVYGYFRREIRKIQRRREEYGLDVDGDDERRRPPPGMG